MSTILQGVQSTQSAATVATATTSFGVLALLQNNVGWMAATAGLALSCVLIYSHIRKGRLERKLLELKIEEAENARISNRANP